MIGQFGFLSQIVADSLLPGHPKTQVQDKTVSHSVIG